jgi:hypothetical protein
MRKLLEISAAAFFLLLQEVAHAQNGNVSVVITPETREFAAKVFVGSDRDMPLDGRYDIALQPTTGSHGKVLVPQSIGAAFQEMERSLPKWYLRALAEASGDHLCFVALDLGDKQEKDYTLEIISWYWLNWNLDSNQTSLRKELEAWGVDNEAKIVPALEVGFCRYLKTGDLRQATDIVKRYGKP